MKLGCVIVLTIALVAQAEEIFDSAGVRVAFKILDDCANSDGLSPCLKKKAFTFFDRLSRMEKFSVADGVTLSRIPGAAPVEPSLTEEQLEQTLPRAADARDAALSTLLMDKFSSFLGSRTLEVSMPRLIEDDEEVEYEEVDEGRGKKIKIPKFKKGKKKGMMGGLLAMIIAKFATLIPLAIAGLFLLAKKALITAKIALLLSGIIAVKKLLAKKAGGGGHVEHAVPFGGGGWQSGGSGWHSGGGGWDKRSLDAQNLAYQAHNSS